MGEKLRSPLGKDRRPLSRAKLFAILALASLLMTPLGLFVAIEGHGFGPCGPANAAGLLGCLGFLAGIPGAIVFGLIAWMFHARDSKLTQEQIEHQPKLRMDSPFMLLLLFSPLMLIGLSMLIGAFLR